MRSLITHPYLMKRKKTTRRSERCSWQFLLSFACIRVLRDFKFVGVQRPRLKAIQMAALRPLSCRMSLLPCSVAPEILIAVVPSSTASAGRPNLHPSRSIPPRQTGDSVPLSSGLPGDPTSRNQPHRFHRGDLCWVYEAKAAR